MTDASGATSSYENLVAALRRSETWSADLAENAPARSAPPYTVSSVLRVGEHADIVIVLGGEPDFEYRVRVALRDENGHPQHWTVAGTYLREFVLTRELLEPDLVIERGPRHLVVDGSRSIY